jgi:hypothetical protein
MDRQTGRRIGSPMRISRVIKARGAGFMIAALAVASTAWATDVNWYLPFGENHLTSDGQPLPAGTRFQIGIFVDGMIPSSSNIDSWSNRWHPVGDISYDITWKGFASVLRVEETPAPLLEGARLYVWGFCQTAAGSSEWFMATHPSWIVPRPDSFSFPFELTVTEGQVIVGTVDPASHSITTAAVGLSDVPRFGWEQWRAQHFFLVERSNMAISGGDADPDGDGVPNAMEYALGTDPRFPDSSGMAGGMTIAKNDDSAVKVSFPGISTVGDAWIVETSQTLLTWEEVSPALSFDLPSRRWAFIHPIESRRFWRLRPKW